MARAFDRRCCTSQAGAFAKDGAPNEAQKEESFWGMWVVAFDPQYSRQ
jgi:hypothetical protein